MPWGPGKYDDVATDVRTKTQAEGVIVLVINGNRGGGFSAQLTPAMTFAMPQILRDMADQIETTTVGAMR
jgi:hypothetical protein